MSESDTAAPAPKDVKITHKDKTVTSFERVKNVTARGPFLIIIFENGDQKWFPADNILVIDITPSK